MKGVAPEVAYVLLTTGTHQCKDSSRLRLATDRPENPFLRHVHAYIFEVKTLHFGGWVKLYQSDKESNIISETVIGFRKYI